MKNRTFPSMGSKNDHDRWAKKLSEAAKQYEQLIRFYTLYIEQAITREGGRKALSNKLGKDKSYISKSLKNSNLNTLKSIAEAV